jgi:hypothetical protein
MKNVFDELFFSASDLSKHLACSHATAVARHLIPEFVERLVFKSRTEADGRKKDSVTFVLISRTNFTRNFVRVLSATVRDLTALSLQLNPGKGLKTNKRDSGI